MKLVMTLLVRNEQDILEANLRYHLEQGVDHFIVTDNNSIDATTDILHAHESEGHLTYILETEDNYAQDKWVTRMAQLAAREYAADWVVNNDADEFWWAKEGNLKSTLSAINESVGIISSLRINYPPRPASDECFFDRMTLRETVSRNAKGRFLPPKVCHRANSNVVVNPGNHSVQGLNMQTLQGPSPIVIHHFPLRSYNQFYNKIEKGGKAFQRNPDLQRDPDLKIGIVWRQLYELLLADKLEEYYASCLLTDDAITAGISAGTLIVDKRIQHALKRCMPASTLQHEV